MAVHVNQVREQDVGREATDVIFRFVVICLELYYIVHPARNGWLRLKREDVGVAQRIV